MPKSRASRVWLSIMAIVIGSACAYDWTVRLLAWKAFTLSRGEASGVDSIEFVTRGIRFGDSESTVDAIMKDCLEASGHRVDLARRGETTYGFEKHYYFEYGPKHISIWPFRDGSIVNERYFVYFDKSGQATGLTRWLFVDRDAKRTGSTSITLQAMESKLE